MTMTASMSSTAPSIDVFASQTGGTGGLAWRNDTTTTRRDIGQTFEASSSGGTLDTISVQLDGNGYSSGASQAAVTLDLYSVSTATANPSTGTLLDAVSGTKPTLTGTLSNDYLTFNLSSDNISLTANGYYAFMLSFPNQAASEDFTLELNTSTNAYAPGIGWQSPDETTFSSVSDDLNFLVTSLPVVPEPPELGLFCFGIGCGLLAFRRRLAFQRG